MQQVDLCVDLVFFAILLTYACARVSASVEQCFRSYIAYCVAKVLRLSALVACQPSCWRVREPLHRLVSCLVSALPSHHPVSRQVLRLHLF